MLVESIDINATTSVSSTAVIARTAANIRAYVPSCDQRRCRYQSDCHGPKSVGTSRHGDPVRNRQAIPSKARR